MVKKVNNIPFNFSLHTHFEYMDNKSIKYLSDITLDRFDDVLLFYSIASNLSTDEIEERLNDDPILYKELQKAYIDTLFESDETDTNDTEIEEPEKFDKQFFYKKGMGVLGYTAKEVLELTLKQFFSALSGKYEFLGEKIDSDTKVLYSALRYNSANIAGSMNGKVAKQISKQKFDWEKNKSSSKRKNTASNLQAKFASQFK